MVRANLPDEYKRDTQSMVSRSVPPKRAASRLGFRPGNVAQGTTAPMFVDRYDAA